jgi:sodium pump decarboxylase gamma subunit
MNPNVSQLLLDALGLLAIGMLVVFSFLIVLIAATNLLSALCVRFPASEDKPARQHELKQAIFEPTSADAETVAAISVAIKQYRQSR